jgi:hypothetical protein
MERLLLAQEAQKKSMEAALANATLEQFDARDRLQKDLALESAKRKIATLEQTVSELTPKHPKKPKLTPLHAGNRSLTSFGITVSKRVVDPVSQEVVLQDQTRKIQRENDCARSLLRLPCSVSGCDRVFNDMKGFSNHMRRHNKQARKKGCESSYCRISL